jgi:hypothetical protein
MPMRVIRIIDKHIASLQVNLNGAVVLTELGSNYYQYLPLIAARAGAKKVYALAKDNRYGKAAEVIASFQQFQRFIPTSCIVECLANEIPLSVFEDTDVITNSGNLRPLSAEFLKSFQKKIVIPLMFEAWEIREQDLDIGYCKEQHIPVAGTNEHHPLLEVFRYCGLLAMKLAFEAGYEVFGNSIAIYSNDDFGTTISSHFKKEGGRVHLISSPDELYALLPELDFVFLAKYDENQVYFGEQDAVFDHHRIKESNPSLGFIHLYGEVDAAFCNEQGIPIYPNKQGRKQVMTETLGYVGLEPIIRLQTGGLKVAEEMRNLALSSLSQPISGF